MSDNFLFWSYCHEVRFEGKHLMKNFMTVSSETKLMFLKLAFNRVLRAPSNSCSYVFGTQEQVIAQFGDHYLYSYHG